MFIFLRAEFPELWRDRLPLLPYLTLMGFCVSTLVYGMSCGLFGSPGSTNPNSKCFTSSDGSFDLASLGDRDRDLCRRLFLLNVVTSSDSVSAPEFTYPDFLTVASLIPPFLPCCLWTSFHCSSVSTSL